MPSLMRIVSCDERDEEEERARVHKDDWVVKKQDVATMKLVREGSESSCEEGVMEVLHGRVVEDVANGMAGLQLGSETQQARPAKARKGFGAYSRNEAGVWTR